MFDNINISITDTVRHDIRHVTKQKTFLNTQLRPKKVLKVTDSKSQN